MILNGNIKVNSLEREICIFIILPKKSKNEQQSSRQPSWSRCTIEACKEIGSMLCLQRDQEIQRRVSFC